MRITSGRFSEFKIVTRRPAIPNLANNLNRKGHTGRKESLVWLLLCRGFAFYALCVVEAALHLELLPVGGTSCKATRILR